MDESEEPPPSNVNTKVKKTYEMHAKKTMSIIAHNLADNKLMYMRICKGPVEAWKILYNIHKTRSLSIISSLAASSSRAKCDDLLNYINKVKVFADRFAYLEILVRNKDVMMIFLRTHHFCMNT